MWTGTCVGLYVFVVGLTGALLVTTLVTVASVEAQTTATAQVSHSGKGAYEPSLARVGNRLAVVWYDTRGERADIYFSVLDGKGQPEGGDRRVTSGVVDAYEPDVQSVGSDLALVWYEKRADGALTAKLGRWRLNGEPRWIKTLSAPHRNGRNPVVRVTDGKLFAAWLEAEANHQPEVWGAWFEGDGDVVGGAIRLAPAGETTWNLNAAIDRNGRAWVAFDARVGTRSDELFLVQLDGKIVRTMRVSEDDGFDSKYPDLSFNEDRAALTWFDTRYGNEEVHLLVTSVSDLKEGSRLESRARRVTDSTGESIGAYLAWNGPTLGLAWCDNSQGQHEIYVQRFNDRGVPVGEPLQLTHNDTSSLIPAIRAWRDGFAIAWNEFAPGRLGPHDPDGRSQVVFATVDFATVDTEPSR